MKALMRTGGGLGALIARVALAVAIFPHGAQKVLGWFGGAGYEKTVAYFTIAPPDGMGLPEVIAILVMFGELLGSIGLLFGFLTRLAALGIGIIMVGAAVTVHYPTFFMNWNQVGGRAEGFEYHILAVGLALLLVIQGGGWLSLDRKLSQTSPSHE